MIASHPYSFIENENFKEMINLGYPDLNLLNVLKESIFIIKYITITANGQQYKKFVSTHFFVFFFHHNIICFFIYY